MAAGARRPSERLINGDEDEVPAFRLKDLYTAARGATVLAWRNQETFVADRALGAEQFLVLRSRLCLVGEIRDWISFELPLAVNRVQLLGNPEAIRAAHLYETAIILELQRSEAAQACIGVLFRTIPLRDAPMHMAE